jgi:hypothetical protein
MLIQFTNQKLQKMKPLKVLMMAALTTIAIPVFAQNSTGKASAEPSKKVKYNISEHEEAMLQKTGTPPACCMNLTKSPKEQMKMNIMKIYTGAMAHDGVPYYATLSPKEQMKIDLMKIDGNKTSTYPKSKPVLYLSPKEKMKMVVLGM